MGDSKTREWTLLIEQFELLVRAKGVRTDDVEELLDIEFQRRLAELIEQALKRRRKIGHWRCGHDAGAYARFRVAWVQRSPSPQGTAMGESLSI
jgi:hypothetical protein